MKGMFETLLSEVIETDWVKVASKHYKHKTGVQVKYNHNAWKWEVIGGAKCGMFYSVKWEAQTEGIKK
jgi:hypothetical protein